MEEKILLNNIAPLLGALISCNGICNVHQPLISFRHKPIYYIYLIHISTYFNPDDAVASWQCQRLSRWSSLKMKSMMSPCFEVVSALMHLNDWITHPAAMCVFGALLFKIQCTYIKKCICIHTVHIYYYRIYDTVYNIIQCVYMRASWKSWDRYIDGAPGINAAATMTLYMHDATCTSYSNTRGWLIYRRHSYRSGRAYNLNLVLFHVF